MVSTNKRSVWWKPRGVGKGRGGVRGRGQVLSQGGAIEHLVVVRACTVEVLVHWLSVVQSELGVAGVVHSGSGVVCTV